MLVASQTPNLLGCPCRTLPKATAMRPMRSTNNTERTRGRRAQAVTRAQVAVACLPRFFPCPSTRSNGNGGCKLHPHTAPACRACLVQGLQEFRFTNLRAGLRIAADRISALRAGYAAKGGAEVKATMVAYELGTLLARLRVVEDQVQDLPGDAGLIHRVMLNTNGRRVAGRAS